MSAEDQLNARDSDPEEKHMELQPPAELIQFTLDHFADMAFWIRPDARFVYVNQTTCSLLGYSREELLEMHVWDIDPKFHASRWKSHWKELQERGSFRIESEHHAKNGSIIPVEIYVHHIIHQDREYNFAFARDLREKKRSERLLDALNRAGRAIDRALTYDTIFQAASMELEAIEFSIMLLLLDGDKQRLHTSFIGVERSLIRAIEKLVGVKQNEYSFPVDQIEAYRPVIREGNSVLVENVVPVMRDVLPRAVKGFARQIVNMLGFETLIAVPFLVNDDVRGLLSVQGKDLSKNDIPGFIAFSQHVAAAWQKAEMYELAQQEIQERREIELQLREERDRAENYFDIAAVVMIALDREGIVSAINQRGVELLGCGEDDLDGLDFVEEFIPENWKQSTAELLHSIIQAGNPRGDISEIPLRSRCGTEYNVHWRFSLIRNAGGSVTGVLASGEDVTDRKRTEIALQESEERFRKMAESISDGLTLIENGKIQYVNTRLCEILGYSREEIMQMVLMEFSAPEESGRVKAFLRQIAEIGTSGDVFELWVEHKDGSRRYIQNRYSRDVHSEHPDRFYVVTSDITDRKLADEEQERLLTKIQNQADRIQHVIDTVPAGVILLDQEFILVQSNRLGEAYLQQLSDIQVGEPLTHLGGLHLEQSASDKEGVVWQDINHEDQVYEVAVQSLIESGSSHGWVLVVREVTRERQESAQIQQQERLASIGLLAGGIAHDFNNALMPITLYSEILLMDSSISKRSLERLETILTQAKHAGALTQQILDFSRRSILERITVDLSSLVREQVRLLKRTLPEHIRIELDYDREDHLVDVDATRIQQALMNLALNARDAMPNGGMLSVSVDSVVVSENEDAPVPHLDAGKWVRLSVSDSGMGIAEENLEHIFEPFFTTKEPGMGSGLGLAQVYGIVMQHGGQIMVESQIDVGTTFTIYLPEVKLHFEPVSQEKSQLPLGQGEKILVVEDDATVRSALADVLTALRYKPLTAVDGKDALETLAKHKDICLVLSDVVMPEMGGKELLEILRQRGDSIPFILMTGHPLKDELEELLQRELSGWMMKSAGTDRLAYMLAEALKRPGDRALAEH